MKALGFWVVTVLALSGAGCTSARVVALSEPRTTYVVRSGFFGTYVLRCSAQQGPEPAPVCAGMREVGR